jgi:hydrogenase large subunit
LTDGAIDYPDGYIFPQNVILASNIKTLVGFDQAKVTEHITHSWYSGTDKVHPSTGSTNLNYTGPEPDPVLSGKPYMLDEAVKYSWIKSPRYDGQPMEVGPLAHILIMYARSLIPSKALPTDKLVKYYVDNWWSGPVATGGLGLAYNDLNSTLGRIFCRMLETKIIVDQMAGRPAVAPAGVTTPFTGWYNQYYANRNGKYFNPNAFTKLAAPATLPDKVGFGFTEAPRGALGHWVKINRTTGMIDNYQCIVASQWNAGPRDAANVPGPYETALKGHTLAKLNQPLEVLRTIHSFDPCIGCAVHILDADGQPLVEVDINHATR